MPQRTAQRHRPVKIKYSFAIYSLFKFITHWFTSAIFFNDLFNRLNERNFQRLEPTWKTLSTFLLSLAPWNAFTRLFRACQSPFNESKNGLLVAQRLRRFSFTLVPFLHFHYHIIVWARIPHTLINATQQQQQQYFSQPVLVDKRHPPCKTGKTRTNFS